MEAVNKLSIESQIEAILFWKAEPISISKIASILDTNEDNIKSGIILLADALKDRGITLVQSNDEIMLGTASEMSSVIESLTKSELEKDLGKAGLETLSIILYQGPISRSEIDYIRGVNSQFILRNLLIRGLIEKVNDTMDQRIFLYKSSLQLLSYLGISNIQDIPDYNKIREDIHNFKNQNNDKGIKD